MKLWKTRRRPIRLIAPVFLLKTRRIMLLNDKSRVLKRTKRKQNQNVLMKITTEATSTSTKGTPGFGILAGIMGILFTVYLRRK